MNASGPVDGARLHERFCRSDTALGDEFRTLVVGDLGVHLAGLDHALAEELDRRWGGYLGLERPSSRKSRNTTVRFVRGGSGTWLPRSPELELYRIEALNDRRTRIVASYHFALGRHGDGWRVAIDGDPDEPLGRIAENAVRFVVAALAVENGGFAMHAAGVLRGGRAWIFAGPSRAGKSTAVRLSRPAIPLGDDFALVLPAGGAWMTAALPFDNSEMAAAVPVEGLIPVAGVWRLFQADTARVEVPGRVIAVASLMSCVAFPWTMPEQADRILGHVGRFVDESRYGHLYFAKRADFWTRLVVAGGDRD